MRNWRVMTWVMLVVLVACGGDSPADTPSEPATSAAPSPTAAATAAATEPAEARTVDAGSDAAKTLRVMLAEVEYARALANASLTIGGEVDDTASETCTETWETFGDHGLELSGELMGVSIPVTVDDAYDDAEEQVLDALEDCIERRTRSVERLGDAKEAFQEAALMIAPEL